MLPDSGPRTLSIKIVCLEAGAVALGRKPAEVDARRLACTPIHQGNRACLEPQAEEAADRLEIIVNELIPIMIERVFAIRGSCPLLRGFVQLVKPIDGRLFDLRHRPALPRPRRRVDARQYGSP